jgi:hypothetical protein
MAPAQYRTSKASITGAIGGERERTKSTGGEVPTIGLLERAGESHQLPCSLTWRDALHESSAIEVDQNASERFVRLFVVFELDQDIS